MPSANIVRRCLLIMFATLVTASPVAADYIISGDYTYGGVGLARIHDDGTRVMTYGPPPELYERYGGGYGYGLTHTVTADLTKVYTFTTATDASGASHINPAFDVANGQRLPGLVASHPSLGQPSALILPHGAITRAVDPVGTGDLFVITDIGAFGLNRMSINRFNTSANSYVHTIYPPTPQTIDAIAFGPDNRLYMSAEQGIFVYQETSPPQPSFELVGPGPLIAGVRGQLTFGADGLLYVLTGEFRQFFPTVVSGDVNRYDPTTGRFVDTFIPEGTFGAPLQQFKLGVDGNFHALTHTFGPLTAFTNFLRIDAATGQLISTTTIPGAAYELTYLAVPEPAVFLMAGIATCFLAARYRVRRFNFRVS